MASLKDRFRTSTAEAAALQDEKVKAVAPSKRGGRPGYLSIDDGPNMFRIYPFHPDGRGEFYAEPKMTVWLEVEVPKRDDEGNLIPNKKEVKNKSIFNSKLHGNLDNDLVETYMELMKEKVEEEEYDDKKKKERLRKLLGGMTGLRYRNTRVMYADKHEGGKITFGRLEVSEATFEKIKALAAKADEPGSPMTIDPFTDPEDGVAIILSKNPEAKPADYYTVDFHTEKQGKFNFSIVPTPLSEEQMEAFLEQEPLSNLFQDAFKKKDFLYQLEGLERFDDKNDVGIFVEGSKWYDRLMEVAAAINEQLPDEEEEENEEEEVVEEKVVEKPKKTSTRVVSSPKQVVAKKEEVEEEEQEEQPQELSKEDRMAKFNALKARFKK